MTGNLAHQTGFKQSCTYQHLIGDMLIRLNRLSEELKLTHSEYRVMASIIGLYNKGHGKAYPTIEYLTKVCCMGKATIIKALKRLTELDLIQIYRQPGIRNNYYIGERLLTGIQILPGGSSACKTAHDINKQSKTNRIIHENKQKNNDDFNKLEYKQVIGQLNKWSFSGAEFIIKKHNIQKIKNLIDLVKIKNPDNPGAYLRNLLNLPGHNIPAQKNECIKSDSAGAIISINQVKAINEPRLTKKEILQKLIEDNQHHEALTLSKLWKLNFKVKD